MQYNLIRVGLVTLAIAACSSGGGSHHDTPKPIPTPTPGATSAWAFGPIINGENFTKGMPARPTTQGTTWYFDFKNKPSEVDAVVNKTPPNLVGATKIVLRYSVTGGGFLASGENNVPGRVGISVQRKGDNWSGTGKYQQYRLYGQPRPLLAAGSGTIEASTWTDVQGKVASPAVVATVFANADNISIVFGGSFASHGVYATQPSRFTFVGLETK